MSKQFVTSLVFVALLLVFIFIWPYLNPFLVWALLFAVPFIIFISLSIVIAPAHGHTLQIRASTAISINATQNYLPPVPRTLSGVYALGDKAFEPFAAALVIGLGEGHRFLRHTGQSGDQGVDAVLLNQYSQKVIVQAKLYAQDNHVGSPELRDFLGSLTFHSAVYGFFVTTSSFTADARQVIDSTNRIRVIDGEKIQEMLCWRNREIALAWRETQG